MEQYLKGRAVLFNEGSQFSCPDWCERYGCKESDVHISISLVDLVAISRISGQRVLDHFGKDCKVGFDPIDEAEPWLGRISIELRKPCSFLDARECSVYPGRPIACALFPEYSFIVGNQESLLKKDVFRNFPCVQNPCSIPLQRRRILQAVMDMSVKEAFLSDFYLFGVSPFVLDLKSIAGEGLEGIDMLEEKRVRIPYQRIEGLIARRMKEGGYWDEWERRIEQLDRANGIRQLAEMKSWTDQIAMAQDRISLGIAYQFDGDKLVQIGVHK